MLNGLIIDEQRNLHQSLRGALLQTMGSEPDSAFRLNEAERFLRQAVYDYIVVDPMTESLSKTLNALLRAQSLGLIQPFCALIVLSAKNTPAFVNACADLAPDSFFLKPARLPELMSRLRAAIDRKSKIKTPLLEHERLGDPENTQRLFGLALKHSTTAAQKLQTLKAQAIFSTRQAQFGVAKQAAHKMRGVANIPQAKLLYATALLTEGETSKAIDLLEELLSERPLLIAGYDLLAEAKYAQGAGPEALAARVKANGINPLNADRSVKLSSEAYDLGAMPLAQSTVEYQLEHIPSLEAAPRLATLAGIHLARKNTAEAIKILALAQHKMGVIDADSSPQLIIARIHAALSQEKVEEAQTLLGSIVALEASLPGPKPFLTEAAFCAYRLGQSELGDHWLERALLRLPHSYTQFERIKDIMRELGLADRLSALATKAAKARAAQAARALQFKQAGLLMDLAQDAIEWVEHADADVDSLTEALSTIVQAGESGQLHQAGSVLVEVFERRINALQPHFAQKTKLLQLMVRFEALKSSAQY